MSIIFYTISKNQWSYSDIDLYSLSLPLFLQKRLSPIVNPQKKQKKIIALLLLRTALKMVGLNHISLNDLSYTPSGKPIFDGTIHCSISYTEDYTAIILSNKLIGIDIEKIKRIKPDDFKEYLTKNEWEFIINSPDVLESFFIIWTRKEALLKTVGSGLLNPINEFEVLRESVTIKKMNFTFLSKRINEDYIVSLATTLSFGLTHSYEIQNSQLLIH